MRLNNRIYDALMRILLVLLYFVPYGFMAILADVKKGTIAGYVVAALTLGLLALLSGLTHHKLVALGGLLLSTLTSLSLIIPRAGEWSAFTKPLSPTALLIIVMGAALCLHVIIWKLIDRKRKN